MKRAVAFTDDRTGASRLLERVRTMPLDGGRMRHAVPRKVRTQYRLFEFDPHWRPTQELRSTAPSDGSVANRATAVTMPR
jgi:hypothetical protein